MLLVVGPVEPTPFGCRLSTLEGWCVACDVADPWPSAAAPLPDIFPSIVYRSCLSLSYPDPPLVVALALALQATRWFAGAPKCAKCVISAACATEQLRKKKRHVAYEGCVAPTGTWIGGIPGLNNNYNSLFLLKAAAFLRESSSCCVPFSGPITGSHLTGRTSNQDDQFSRHQATTTRIRAFFFFFFFSMTCGAGLAPPVRFSTSQCAFSRRMVLLGFTSVKLPKFITEASRGGNTVVFQARQLF